jgi:nucleolar GTP-binding protein
MEIENQKKKLERDIEMEMGDDYILDLKKNYDIEGDQKFDVIPEIWNGHNIADFIDPDILKKLEALEREEELRINSGFYDNDDTSEDEETREMRGLAKRIRDRKAIMKAEQRMNQTNKPKLPRNPRKVLNSCFKTQFINYQIPDEYQLPKIFTEIFCGLSSATDHYSQQI